MTWLSLNFWLKLKISSIVTMIQTCMPVVHMSDHTWTIILQCFLVEKGMVKRALYLKVLDQTAKENIKWGSLDSKVTIVSDKVSTNITLSSRNSSY